MMTNITRITAGLPWPAPSDSSLVAARKLIARGCMVLPVAYRHKEPPRGWKKLRIEDGNAGDHFSADEPGNVGVMLGRRSGGLVDVNLDCIEALIAAPKMLPPALVFGRAGKPRSHWLLYADNARHQAWADPDTGAALVELRADTATGDPTHTVFPPSVHEESGERITFEDGPQEPAQTTAPALHQLCAELAAAALLLRRWRDVQPRDLVGALIRGGWDGTRITTLFSVVTTDNHSALIRESLQRHAESKPLPGWGAIEKAIGAKHAKALEQWLNARAVAQRGNFTSRPVADMVPDAPAKGLLCPHGYALGPDETVTTQAVLTATGTEAFQDVVIAPTPILMTGRIVGETESVRLTWRTDDVWRSVICPRRTAMDASHLIALTDQRFPVGTDNTKHVAKYLRHFEAANMATIPTARVTTQLGWQKDRGFLWGTQLIDGETRHNADLTETDPDQWPKDALSFQALSDGDRRFAKAFRSRGTLDGWIETMETAARFPLVIAGMYASFIPIIAPTLGIHNFILSWSCTTSHGKTSALRVAASPWGDPDDQSPDGSVIGRWNATRVGIESRCAMSNGLPLFIDDTKQVKRRDYVESVVYDVAAAQTGLRGEMKGGGRPVHSFRTVMFTTGEAALHTFADEGSGGARARTVEINEPPWGEATDRTLPIVDGVNAGVFTNHGLAGPAFVEWWLSQRAAWPEHQAEHEKTRARYAALAKSGEEARLLDYVAAIDSAAWLLGKAIELPFTPRASLEELTRCVHSEAKSVRPEDRAIEFLWSWMTAHQQEFLGRHRETARTIAGGGEPFQPAQGFAGAWAPGDAWEHVDWHPSRLDALLKENGWEPKEALKAWRRAGFLDCESERLTRTTRISGELARVYRIRRHAVVPGVPGE